MATPQFVFFPKPVADSLEVLLVALVLVAGRKKKPPAVSPSMQNWKSLLRTSILAIISVWFEIKMSSNQLLESANATARTR